jgi:hypothetical protein
MITFKEMLDLEEGRVKELQDMIKAGKSAEEIAKKLKVNVQDVKDFMKANEELDAPFEEGLDEALTMQQRLKRKVAFKKAKAKIALGRKKAAKKLASPEKIKNKAVKQARDIITKKILKDKDKGDLSFAGRQSLEKKVDKKKSVINKIAKKLISKVRQKDREKLKRRQEK